MGHETCNLFFVFPIRSVGPLPRPVALVFFACGQAYESTNGKEDADKVANYFGPAVEHLGKWMPLYLAPPLIVLPNALSEVRMRKRGPVTAVQQNSPLFCGSTLLFCVCSPSLASWKARER